MLKELIEATEQASTIELEILAVAMFSVGIVVALFYWVANRIIRRLDKLLEVEQQAFGPLIQTDRRRKLSRFIELDSVAFFFNSKAVRDNLLRDLPQGLVSQIPRDDAPLIDMQNIIYTTSNWGDDAFQKLISAIEERLGADSDAQKIFSTIKKSLGGNK